MNPGRSLSFSLLSFLLLLAVAAACSSKPPSESRAETIQAPSSSVADPPSAGVLVFTAQPGWAVETPSSSMRKAQYRLPHAESDGEDASLVVYFFSGQGGSPQANIDRWAGQFEQPDGRPSSEVLHNVSRTVNGMKATEVDLSGNYVAETAPGSGEHLRKEGWRMLAAILEAKEGPYYIKLVGPRATVARWEASYREFVSGMKPGG